MSADQEVEPELDETASEPEGDYNAVINDALRQILATEPTVILDAIIAALRIAKDAAKIPKDRFHVVIIPDVGEGSVETVNSIEELVAVLRTTRQQGGQAFGFRGDLLLPSKGGHYLVTPWGRFPIFAEDRDTEVDPSGRLGPVPAIPQAVPAAPSVPADNGDDESLDDEVMDDDDVDDEGVDDDDDDE